jgi:hypothetical protein
MSINCNGFIRVFFNEGDAKIFLTKEEKKEEGGLF